MGSGIAQVLAQAGHEVLLKGRSEASLAKAHKAMEKNLSRMVEKGKMEAAVKEQALSRVKDTLNYEDCAGVELVINQVALFSPLGDPFSEKFTASVCEQRLTDLA